MKFEIVEREFYMDIDKTYSIEIKHREKYEVVAVKKNTQGEFQETTLSRHILECDAENKKMLIEEMLKKEDDNTKRME